MAEDKTEPASSTQGPESAPSTSQTNGDHKTQELEQNGVNEKSQQPQKPAEEKGAEKGGEKGGEKEKKEDKKSKDPAGGYDTTPIPKQPAGYTVRFTFHKAVSLPMADINTLSSDPYLLVQLNTALQPRHKEDPLLRFRTHTVQRDTDPVWNSTWTVAHVPASGFKMKIRVYDEDPFDHDDRLGNVHVTVPSIGESFKPIKEQAFKIRKRMGSKRAYFIRGCAALFNRNIELTGRVFLSVEVLGRSEGPGGRVYTVGPLWYFEHFSPLLGRITGTKEGQASKKKVQRYNFQANELQLRGPVPADMYHRYVEFKPFIKGMFSKKGIRGRILNRALHHQHARIYNFDASTVHGLIEKPGRELALQFLDMVHYDEGFRIWTYVITLDGLMRFTETGKEFGIDMLSKHTMHCDVDNYIAYSGEFFVRRHGHSKNRSNSSLSGTSRPSEKIEDIPHSEYQKRKAARRQNSDSLEVTEDIETEDDPHADPSIFTLHIDNDSGTYRPAGSLLPQLRSFLEENFVGLRIKTGDCMDEKLQDAKKEQRERKKKEGQGLVFVQDNNSSDSLSSSDMEGLDRLAATGSRKSAKGLAMKKAALKNIVHGGMSGGGTGGGDGAALKRPNTK